MKTSKWFWVVGALVCAGASDFVVAQGYKWRDDKGVIVYSDQPPPKNIPPANILQSPKAKAADPAPVAAGDAAKNAKGAAAAPAAASAPKTIAEREAEYKKRQAENQKKAKEESEKSAQEQQRLAACESLRQNLVTLESGQRMAKVDSKGERYFVGDDERAKDIAKARQDMAASKCT